MGLIDLLKRLFGGIGETTAPAPAPAPAPAGTLGLDELARRLAMPLEQLRAVPIAYRQFSLPKRRGGTRTISAPQPALMALQRRILRFILARLQAHPCAHGFERGRSIVTNALPHERSTVIIRLDIQDFFGATTARRIENYFRAIGWDAEAAALLTQWTTLDGALPQGAPTSPRLSNLVNGLMDRRLSGAAAAYGGRYTRYADDLTFSFGEADSHEANCVIPLAKKILADLGYRLHMKKKLSIRRAHQRQQVTGLVVNDRVRLPRETRRRLRAIRHHIDTGRPVSITADQFAGWMALEQMIALQAPTDAPQ